MIRRISLQAAHRNVSSSSGWRCCAIWGVVVLRWRKVIPATYYRYRMASGRRSPTNGAAQRRDGIAERLFAGQRHNRLKGNMSASHAVVHNDKNGELLPGRAWPGIAVNLSQPRICRQHPRRHEERPHWRIQTRTQRPSRGLRLRQLSLARRSVFPTHFLFQFSL